MKVDKVVKRETIKIGIGILVFSSIVQVVFLILGKYSLAVLLGSVYGGVIALLNFFFMGLAVQGATAMEDPNEAKRKMQSSYSMRQLGLLFTIGAGVYISVHYGIFHWLPILLAVFYPRLTITIQRIFIKEEHTEGGDTN